MIWGLFDHGFMNDSIDFHQICNKPIIQSNKEMHLKDFWPILKINFLFSQRSSFGQIQVRNSPYVSLRYGFLLKILVRILHNLCKLNV